MRTMLAGVLALALLALASPPAHALDRHDANVSSTQPDGAPPLVAMTPADAQLGTSTLAVAHPGVASTADASLSPIDTGPEVLAVAHGRGAGLQRFDAKDLKLSFLPKMQPPSWRAMSRSEALGGVKVARG